MKLSINFLKDYVDVPVDMHTLGEDMTNVGNEYDSAKKLIDVTGLTIGKILECENHPDSDHLWVTQIDTGNGKNLQIVTGAQNLKVSDLVPVALDNSVLPGGKEIHSTKMRGVDSFGMLCSGVELGLTEDLFIGFSLGLSIGFSFDIFSFSLSSSISKRLESS